MKKVSEKDILFGVKAFEKNGEPFNLGLVFRKKIPNFALKFLGESYVFNWDMVFITMDFKSKKRNLYDCEFECTFMHENKPVFALKQIRLTKLEYKPYLTNQGN